MSESSYMPSGEVVISTGDREWFLTDLARQYLGAPVHVRSDGPIGGEARDCKLHGITAQPDSIVLFMMCDQSNETRYAVANPRSLVAHRNEEGITESLTIVALDGSVTRVWFGDAVARRDDRELAA